MRKEEVDPALSDLAFDFFFWFSRFEFALKENNYLKSHAPGDNAEPGWKDFVAQWAGEYSTSAEAQALLASPPTRQIVGANGSLEWKPVGLNDCKSDLAKVARLVATVRNNLFHGGKHSAAGWDDPQRTRELLNLARPILDQLSKLGPLEGDYLKIY